MFDNKCLDRFVDDFLERMHVMNVEQLERIQMAAWVELTDRDQREEEGNVE